MGTYEGAVVGVSVGVAVGAAVGEEVSSPGLAQIRAGPYKTCYFYFIFPRVFVFVFLPS